MSVQLPSLFFFYTSSKIDAWKEIERAFNQDETSKIYRPHYVLRTKFDNLKRLKKRNSARKVRKLSEGSAQTSSPTNDAEDDCFESFKTAIAGTFVFALIFFMNSYFNFSLICL